VNEHRRGHADRARREARGEGDEALLTGPPEEGVSLPPVKPIKLRDVSQQMRGIVHGPPRPAVVAGRKVGRNDPYRVDPARSSRGAAGVDGSALRLAYDPVMG